MRRVLFCAVLLGMLLAAGQALAASFDATVTWADVANETGYRVERKVGAGAYSQVGQVGENVIAFAETGLAINTTYCYRIISFNSVGAAASSPEGCGTTGVPPDPVTGAPTILFIYRP